MDPVQLVERMPLNATDSPTTTSFAMTSSSLVPSSTQDQQFCLRWNNYHSNLSAVFDQLYQNESFVDVTLVSEGRSIKAHKMVLAASSPYFQTIFFETPCKHPIVIIKDVKWEELKALVEFMYRGEINVAQEQIRPLLKLAEMFQIRGLTDVTHEPEQEPVQENNVEQFTVYAALNSEHTYEDLSVTEKVSNKKRSSKERELARKQTLEALDIPVEWPNEEVVESTMESNCRNERKRKYMIDSDENTTNKFEQPEDSYQNIPTTIPQPTVVVPPPPPALLLQPTFQPEDADSKMSFLDGTNEGDDASFTNSQEWTSSTPESRVKQKAPAWNWGQLQEAIAAVVTQRLRFTQASAQYNIPKGTLYDNILGKAHRMAVLQELPLSPGEEAAVLEFCCDTSTSPYNKRTKKSLKSILEFLAQFSTYRAKGEQFSFGGKPGFRWWWAFCRKHSIVSLYYEGMKLEDKEHEPKVPVSAKKGRKSMEFDDGGLV